MARRRWPSLAESAIRRRPGIVIGYFLFIYFQPTEVKDVKVCPLVEYDSNSLDGILHEIPLWVKNPDCDRIDWVSRFLEMMWPYLNKAICKTAQDIANPIIAENKEKYKIDSIEFETLTLGSLPPTFQGMKAYVTEEQELIMEPSLKWAANPNVTVVVKAYGLKATIQVVDLQVFASPRITLKPLVATIPCFAKILVSLMEKPHVDFGLKLLGADVMAIPILYSFVQETIKKQVASIASKRPVGILLVKVLRAQNLQKKDLLGKSDPYVKLTMSDDKLPSKKTTVKRGNLNPEWNEDFKFVVTDPETQELEIKVGKHDKMGMNKILLKELPPEETKVTTYNLLKTMDPNDIHNEKSRGQITLEMTYKPFKEDDIEKDVQGTDVVGKAPDGTPAGGGLLYVVVHEAQDLEGKHHTNPYARIIFKGNEKKTKVIKKNRDPRWEEEIEFVCEEPPANDKLHVEVLSKPPKKGLIHGKETLGYIDINLADVISNKRINETNHLIDSKTVGIVIGYFLFIYFQPTDVKNVKVRPLVEYDSDSLDDTLPEIPLWLKNPDYDRLDWLNRFLELMWPYLNKAICRIAQDVANPIIAKNKEKYKIDYIKFETFTLGSLPPTFQGVKVQVTNEQELVMEPSLKWAGNPNTTVVVKAYGLKATIQVVDMQVFVLPRITLKPLVSSFPCFANILVSLMEKPHVDFGLKLLGADVMAIPVLYKFVQETIMDQVASMFLWPKTLEVPIMDPSKASKKPVGILLVKVLRAQNLREKGPLGKRDPYVKLKMSGSKLPSKKTAVKHSNLNPEWNQEFKFVIRDPETQELDINFGKDEKLGMCKISLKKLTPGTEVITDNLIKTMEPNGIQNEKSAGEITLELTYKPFKEGNIQKEDPGGLLYVVVHEAKELEGKCNTNPYVKLTFKGVEKKTKVVKENRNPRWKEEFEFECEETPANDKLHVEVLGTKKALIRNKESLGHIDISLADVIINKRIIEMYDLINSKRGQIQIEFQWKSS
uniref:Synaptotagmin n=1 Tax=Oryza rufipogon TaxID=4529 RepID=A0A0E0N465_ORYRU